MSTSAGRRLSTSASRPARVSPRQRALNATESLREALRLPPRDGDANDFASALAEVAAMESRRNERFAEAIRGRYRELVAGRASVTGTTKVQVKTELPPLVPIRQIPNYHADPFKAPDPKFLINLYGPHQLERALQDYTLETLKETAANVQAEHPGTRPANKGRRDTVIAYIVKYSLE